MTKILEMTRNEERVLCETISFISLLSSDTQILIHL